MDRQRGVAHRNAGPSGARRSRLLSVLRYIAVDRPGVVGTLVTLGRFRSSGGMP
jgi:hypothetical protein